MVASHVKQLFTSGKTPALPQALAAIPEVVEIHDYIVQLRKRLGEYAKGNFTNDVTERGIVAGSIKAIQANMRHLIWQMGRVQKGSLAQRIDFMGDFSDAFNIMVTRLDNALTSLREKEDELLVITNELKSEVDKRGAALSALKKSEETFRYLAEHDPLTSLLNRRSFIAQSEVELARNSIMDTPCCVALMDVDHFKKFNDTHGHLNGDKALRSIAEIGSSTLRSNDYMGRYGGEEFIFFFSKCDLEQGRHAANRVRSLVQDTPIKLDVGTAPTTASFGVTCIPPSASTDGDIMSHAIACADKALYQAKNNGRNNVCTAEFTTSP